MTFLKLFLVCLKVGAFTVGGAASILPVLSHELVTQGHWLTEQEFLYGIALCEGTPGPVVTGMGLVGYKWGGVAGCLLVIFALIMPGIVWMFLLAKSRKRFRNFAIVENFIGGIRPAVPGLLAALALRMERHQSMSMTNILICLLSYGAIMRWKISPAFLVLAGVVCAFFRS